MGIRLLPSGSKSSRQDDRHEHRRGHRQEAGIIETITAPIVSLVKVITLMVMIFTILSSILVAVGLFFGFRKIQQSLASSEPAGRLPSTHRSRSRRDYERGETVDTTAAAANI
jgi:hypothetical protein